MQNLKYLPRASADCFLNRYTLRGYKKLDTNEYYLILERGLGKRIAYYVYAFKNLDLLRAHFEQFSNDLNAINQALEDSNASREIFGYMTYNKKSGTYNIAVK